MTYGHVWSECSFSACGTLCLHLLDHRDENHCEKSSEKKCRHYVPPVLLGLKSIFMATLLWNKTESILFFLMSLILLLSLCVNQAFLLYIWTILSEERRKSVDRWTHDGRDSLGSNPHLVIHHLQKLIFHNSMCHIVTYLTCLQCLQWSQICFSRKFSFGHSALTWVWLSMKSVS